MKEHTFEIGHAQVLLDVIFGVIVALPLIEVPKVAVRLITVPDFAIGATFFLSLAALLFSSFYWLEVRHFLSEQERFNNAVRRDASIPSDGVPLPLATYLVGSLIMMTLAAGILAFANYEGYRTFLLLNVLFWLADLYGTASLKHIYGPYSAVLNTIRQQQPHAYDWFVGHVATPYFYFYGLVNTMTFAVLLLIDDVVRVTPSRRFLASATVLALTVVRHGWVRASLYVAYRDRKLASTPPPVALPLMDAAADEPQPRALGDAVSPISSSQHALSANSSAEERRNRLLQHAIHEDAIFYNRLNFFAVIETVLLTAVATLQSTGGTVLRPALLIMGLLVTLMWSFAQIKSHAFVDLLARRLKRELPEFEVGFNGTDLETSQIATTKARRIITYGLPIMFGAAWLVLLATQRTW
jgi:hypothetical protein